MVMAVTRRFRLGQLVILIHVHYVPVHHQRSSACMCTVSKMIQYTFSPVIFPKACRAISSVNLPTVPDVDRVRLQHLSSSLSGKPPQQAQLANKPCTLQYQVFEANKIRVMLLWGQGLGLYQGAAVRRGVAEGLP